MDAKASSDHPEPPYSVAELSDLDAGLLDPDVAAFMRSRIASDPQAQSILAALAQTRSDLANLPVESAVAPEWVRAQTAQTISALAGETDGDPIRSTARRRVPWLAGVLAAAAIAVIVTLVGVLTIHSRPTPTDGNPDHALTSSPAPSRPAPSSTPGPTSGPAGTANPGVLAVLGRTDAAPFASHQALRRCTEANDVPDSTPVLGSGTVAIDGTEQTVILLGTGQAGRVEALVVGPGCDVGNPALRSRTLIGAH